MLLFLMLVLLVKNTFSLTYYLLVAVDTVDHSRVFKTSGSAIDYQVHVITQALIYKLGIGQIAYVIRFVVGDGCGEQRSTQLAADFTCNIVVWYANSYLLAVAEYLWKTAACT